MRNLGSLFLSSVRRIEHEFQEGCTCLFCLKQMCLCVCFLLPKAPSQTLDLWPFVLVGRPSDSDLIYRI